MSTTKKSIAIIGGGPAAMMLAASLDRRQYDTTIYEKHNSIGRKFLVAGKGGFNLTHSEPVSQLIERYSPKGFMDTCLKTFSNQDLINWLNRIGIGTYIGTSKRIFPTIGIKPIEVLQAIKDTIEKNRVTIVPKMDWTCFDGPDLLFGDGSRVKPDITVLALGGSSWSVTGSDGQWTTSLRKEGIEAIPFRAANCGFKIKWSAEILNKYPGTPLKNISVSFGERTSKGELVLTESGLEGNAIYALSEDLQNALDEEPNDGSEVQIYIDFKPQVPLENLIKKFEKSKAANRTAKLHRDIKLTKLEIAILKSVLGKDAFMDTTKLLPTIKTCPLTVTSANEIDVAISTLGGIATTDLDPHFQLKQLPNVYCIGEMVDWYAPTGGYLLQGAFSMGWALAQHLNGSKKE